MKVFLQNREDLNKVVIDNSDRIMKRLLSVDSQAYNAGALTEQTKELLGLTASLVLRCDDCIAWHVHRCRETGISTEQLAEAMGIGMVVGGSITIPHVRRALSLWESAEREDAHDV